MIITHWVPLALLALMIFYGGYLIGVHEEESKHETISEALIPAEAYAEVNSWVPELGSIPPLQPLEPLEPQAILPSDRTDRTHLRDMVVGDSGYTTPWGMSISGDWRAWLNGSYNFDPHPHGTVTLYVERREDGYYVKIPPGERYTPEGSGRPSGTWGEIPVAGWID